MSQDCTAGAPFAAFSRELMPYTPPTDPWAEVRELLRELHKDLAEIRELLELLACYKSPFALTPEERREWSARLTREGQRCACLLEETRK